MSSSAPYRRPLQPFRYLVTFPNTGIPDVGYRTSLGERQAKDWAIQTARNYSGIVWREWSDGSVERVYFSTSPFTLVMDLSEQAAEAA